MMCEKKSLSGDDINDNYTSQLGKGRFYPLTAVDENERIVGHFIIRYPRDDDNSSVRFGFVIVDHLLRGQGYGNVHILRWENSIGVDTCLTVGIT